MPKFSNPEFSLQEIATLIEISSSAYDPSYRSSVDGYANITSQIVLDLVEGSESYLSSDGRYFEATTGFFPFLVLVPSVAAGAVFYDPTLGRIVVSFRGTDSFTDYVDYPAFARHADAFIPLVDAVKAFAFEHDVDEIVFTGHSLGGAVAEIFAERNPNHLSGLRYSALTVASPLASVDGDDDRVFNLGHENDAVYSIKFATKGDNAVENIYVALNDYIPFVDLDFTDLGDPHNIASLYSYTFETIVSSAFYEETTRSSRVIVSLTDQPSEVAEASTGLFFDEPTLIIGRDKDIANYSTAFSWTGLTSDLVSEDDFLVGGRANDTLEGRSGDDTLRGDVQESWLRPFASFQSGNDVLVGGAGRDTFLGTALELNGDTIVDLEVGDKIHVTDAVFVSDDISVVDGQIVVVPNGDPSKAFRVLADVPMDTILVAGSAPDGQGTVIGAYPDTAPSILIKNNQGAGTWLPSSDLLLIDTQNVRNVTFSNEGSPITFSYEIIGSGRNSYVKGNGYEISEYFLTEDGLFTEERNFFRKTGGNIWSRTEFFSVENGRVAFTEDASFHGTLFLSTLNRYGLYDFPSFPYSADGLVHESPVSGYRYSGDFFESATVSPNGDIVVVSGLYEPTGEKRFTYNIDYFRYIEWSNEQGVPYYSPYSTTQFHSNSIIQKIEFTLDGRILFLVQEDYLHVGQSIAQYNAQLGALEFFGNLGVDVHDFDVKGTASDLASLFEFANQLIELDEGDDTLRGASGDDTIIAGIGNDVIDGRGGVDTFVTELTFSSALISVSEGGQVQITSGNSQNTIDNVEFFQFSDVLKSYAEIVNLTLPPGEIDGDDPPPDPEGPSDPSDDPRVTQPTDPDSGDDGINDEPLGEETGLPSDGDDDTAPEFENPFDPIVDQPVSEPTNPGSNFDGFIDDLPEDGTDLPVSGNDGEDVWRGVGGDDHWTGSFLSEVARGRGGHDMLAGRGGDDTLVGGGGSDTLKGGGGNDFAKGGGGFDRLLGGGSDDILKGGGADDLLKGGAGDDRLEGQRGDDILVGQGGRDVFVFAPGAGSDEIRGFQQNLDQIEILRGASSFSDIELSQAGRDVLITFSNVEITIKGARVGQFDADDFIF